MDRNPIKADTQPQTSGGGIQFGRIPYGIVSSGAIAGLSGAEVKTFLAVCGHANGSWTCRPSLRRICEVTGLTKAAAIGGVKTLVERGLITVDRGGGRGHANQYRILVEKGISQDTLSGAKGLSPEREKGRPHHTLSEAERVFPAEEKGMLASTERVFPGRAKGIPQNTPTEENRVLEQTAEQMAAAGVCHGEGGEPGVASTAADPSDGLRDELSRRGITEPKLSELAKMPGLAAGIVRQLAGRIGRAMNPAGKLIALIEREGPAAVAAAESAAANAVRAANASAARIATDEAKAAEVALERLERHRLLATLAPAELDAYVRRVLDAATTAERQRWDGNTDPARNRLLGQRVVALVLAERAAANGGDQP